MGEILSHRSYLTAGLLLAALLTVPVLILRSYHIVSHATFPPGELLKARGPEAASVVITEYSDFQCPSCQTVQAPLKEILEKHAGKIRLIFRHYPLKTHAFSPIAHQSAECANEQGHFWEYHDRLYDNQMFWSSALNPVDFLLGYAREIGLDTERFVRCLGNTDITERVNRDLLAGKAAGVHSTPTFIIEDKMLVGSQQFLSDAERVIQEKVMEKQN
jgi:protein-disulfide isomerase